MLIIRGNNDNPAVLLRFASLLHIFLKETSARGCDIVALRQRVHLGPKVLGKIYLWLFDTQDVKPVTNCFQVVVCLNSSHRDRFAA